MLIFGSEKADVNIRKIIYFYTKNRLKIKEK
jgi:hypothetical protein